VAMGGTMGRASLVKSRLCGVLRVALGASVLGAGIWVGTASVASPPAAAAEGCLTTSVDATIHNDTTVPLRLYHTRLGVTNNWCEKPTNPLRTDSAGGFEAGDNVFATDISVSYQAPNHDLISLFAKSGYFTDDARCVVVPNGTLPSPYRCVLKWHADVVARGGIFGLGTHVVFVNWTIERP
jgi:hypothetical protein